MSSEKRKKARVKFTKECKPNDGACIPVGAEGIIMVAMESATAIKIITPTERIVVTPYSIKNPDAPFKVIE